MPNFSYISRIDAQDQRIYHDIFCNILYTCISNQKFIKQRFPRYYYFYRYFIVIIIIVLKQLKTY